MNKNNRQFGYWFWNHVSPHILVATLGGIGAMVLPNPTLKLLVLVFSIMVILAMICCRYVLEFVWRIWRLAKGFPVRCSTHHQFVHGARDLIIKLLPVTYHYSHPVLRDKPIANPVLADKKAEIISIMECNVSLFENFVSSGTKVWMSLRDLRSGGCYHTFARAGHFNPAREQSSMPLHRTKSATIRRLRDSLDSQQCVLLTGSTKGPELWTPQPNDQFGADKCVLMGAVLIKAWDAADDFNKQRLVWIITVCADREDAFDATHLPLMQSCVDIFSTIANVMARSPGVRSDGTAQFPTTVAVSCPDKEEAGSKALKGRLPGHDTEGFSI